MRIFSRRLENVTASLPEIVMAARQITAKSAILDGEAVAIGKDGRPMAFQEILKRFRRKYNVEKLAAQIPLRLFLFDLIYLDGKSVIDLPLSERRALLEKIADDPISSLADQVLSGSLELAEEIYRQALEAGHEGLILKNPNSVYAPGKRGKNWLKIKPVMETLDLVVIGAKWGEGRRASFLGSYRLGCLDTATGNLLDMGWVATGLTDEALAELTEMFRELILLEKGMEVEIEAGGDLRGGLRGDTEEPQLLLRICIAFSPNGRCKGRQVSGGGGQPGARHLPLQGTEGQEQFS